MERVKQTFRKKDISFLSFIQQIISIIIGLFFIIGLVPFSYLEIGGTIVVLIVIQIIISIIRLDILTAIFELIILLISILSFIPILGYLFRLLGFIFAIIDFSMHSNSTYVVKNFNYYTNKSKKNKENNKKVSSGKVYEAEYREKK